MTAAPRSADPFKDSKGTIKSVPVTLREELKDDLLDLHGAVETPFVAPVEPKTRSELEPVLTDEYLVPEPKVDEFGSGL